MRFMIYFSQLSPPYIIRMVYDSISSNKVNDFVLLRVKTVKGGYRNPKQSIIVAGYLARPIHVQGWIKVKELIRSVAHAGCEGGVCLVGCRKCREPLAESKEVCLLSRWRIEEVGSCIAQSNRPVLNRRKHFFV